MKYPPENKCKICGSIFCCVKCRSQHELSKHSKELENLQRITNKCSICMKQPLVFRPAAITQDFLTHIMQKHLPLYCQKCRKMYTSEKDLRENWKCSNSNSLCAVEPEASAANIEVIPVCSSPHNQLESALDQPIAASTQTSPSLSRLDRNKNDMIETPIVSPHEMQIKQKFILASGSITDSASSIKNFYSFSTSTQIPPQLISAHAKLVRTTSTPMQHISTVTKEQHFDSSAQVSSIHGSSSESDVSPPSENFNMASSPGNVKPNEPLQITRGRRKMPVSATPLRQVMSKSIQRAIAEHGVLNLQNKGLQPKKIFDSASSSCSISSPLDLRTSPALRRSQSEIVDRSSTYEEFQTSKTSSRKQIVSTSKRIIIEDYVISSNSIYEKLETVFETCKNVESSADPLPKPEKEIEKSPSKVENLQPDTPKKSGVVLKKTISFDTPKYSDSKQDGGEEDEVFYTPKSLLPQTSFPSSYLNSPPAGKSSPPGALKKTFSYPLYNASTVNKNSEENENDQENTKPAQRGRVWSFVTSVMRLASFGGRPSQEPETTHNKPEESMSMIKRCASFAGVISRKKSNEDDTTSQQMKRKRTNTFDKFSYTEPNSTHGGPSKRVKRIEGRKPIERMRKASKDV